MQNIMAKRGTRKVSFEIVPTIWNGRSSWMCRCQVDFVSQEAPRFDTISEALSYCADYIKRSGAADKQKKINIAILT